MYYKGMIWENAVLDDSAIMVHNSEMQAITSQFMTFSLLQFPNSTPLRAHRVITDTPVEGTFDV